MGKKRELIKNMINIEISNAIENKSIFGMNCDI